MRLEKQQEMWPEKGEKEGEQELQRCGESWGSSF